MPNNTLGLADRRQPTSRLGLADPNQVGLGLATPGDISTAGAAADVRSSHIPNIFTRPTNGGPTDAGGATSALPTPTVPLNIGNRPPAGGGGAASGSTAPKAAGGVPNFKDNPLGAIGFLMQQFAAGFRGQETPLDKLRSQGNADRDFELRKRRAGQADQRLAFDRKKAAANREQRQANADRTFNLGQQRVELERQGVALRKGGAFLTALSQGVNELAAAPADQHESIIATYDKNFSDFGIGDRLREASAGNVAKVKATVDAMKQDPGAALFLAMQPGIEDVAGTSLDELTGFMDQIIKTRLNITQALETRKTPDQLAEEAEARAAGTAAAFKPGRVQVRNSETQEVGTFVVETPADRDRLNTSLRSGELVETSTTAPARFQIFREGNTDRFIAIDLQTRDVRTLGESRTSPSETPAIVPLPKPFAGRGGDIGVPGAGELADRGNVFADPTIKLPALYATRNLGVPGFFKEMANVTAGQMPGRLGRAFTFPDVRETRTVFAALATTIKRAYRQSGRPPVVEQDQIMRLLPDEDAFLENREASEAQLGQVAEMLKQQVRADAQFWRDRNNPTDLRNDSLERIRGAREALDLIGPVASTREELNSVGAGQIVYYTPLRKFIRRQ